LLGAIRDITAAVPDDVYRTVRVKAAERSTSVSALVAGYLRSHADQDAELERLQALQAQAAREPGFMEENSPERATAALVQHLETIVAQASPNNRSCAIVNRSPMTQAREPRFPRAVVGVRLRCGNAELASVLHALESGAPRLFVENLNVLSQQSFADASAPGQGLGLDVSFDLVGYVRPTPAGNADAD